MEQEQALTLLRAYIDVVRSAGFHVISAYLFGSAARGEANQDSDIDVALVLENMSDSFDTQVELMKLRRSIDLRIEPHPFSSSDDGDVTGFFEEVLRTGIKVA